MSPCSGLVQVVEDDLNSVRPGFVKVTGDAFDAEPFIGPPCKRPRRPVDAPQV